MLSVEDALERLADLVQDSLYSYDQPTVFRFNKWDQEFILDMDDHIKEGRAVSTAQAAIIIKLIGQHRFYLERYGVKSAAIDTLLANPTYRVTPYQSTVLPREVRWAGGNYLAFRCKYNQNVVDDIKRLRWNNPIMTNHGSPFFVQTAKLWVVQVSEDNMDQTMSVIQRHKFGFDAAVEQMFLRIANTKVNRGTIKVQNDHIVLEPANDFFMHAWSKGILRLDGIDV